jgi:LysR family transcriptional regulator, transcriptional activator for bauABCD operon
MSKLGQLQDIDLKTLRVFCTIVEEGGFSAAQASLNLSQSSLSEYLKTLEVRLGLTLCQRGPKGFHLYEDGKKVYEAAREMLAAIDTFRNQISNINKGAVGQISIAIQDAIVENPACRLPEALAHFDQAYPGVRIRLEVMLGFQVLGRVADSLMPLGICLRNSSLTQVSSTRLFDETVNLYCSNKHPLFSEDADTVSVDLIRSHRYSSRGHLEAIHPEWGEEGNYGNEVGFGAEAQLALTLSGRTIGYIPDHVARPYVEKKVLKRVSNKLERVTPVAIISGPGTSKFRLAKKLLDAIVAAHQGPSVS